MPKKTKKTKRGYSSSKKNTPKRLVQTLTKHGTPKTLGLPEFQKVTLRYVEVISIDPAGSGVVASYAFRANSIYDPNYTSSGHNPSGWNQIAPFYERCHVIRSKCRLEYTPTGTSTSVYAAKCALTCDPDLRNSTDYVSYTDFIEKARSKLITVGNYYNNGNYGVMPYYLYAYFNPRIICAQTDDEYLADTANSCTYTGDIPDEGNIAYFNIDLCDINGGNPDAMTFTVTIDYTCVFSGRLTVPHS